MYLSIVIPTYNEEKNIRKSLARVFSYLEDKDYSYEVLLVDDGSEDRTLEIVREFFGDREELRIIENPHRGKGYTVRTGMLSAEGNYILFTDADLATPIEELDRLLIWLRDRDFEVAIASREGFGAKRIDEPFHRHLMGRVFNFLVRLLALPGINDSQCGFKMFTKEAARDIFKRLTVYGEEAKELDRPYLGAFDVEVLYLARKLGYEIKEIAVTWQYVETVRLNALKDSWQMFLDVVQVRINDLRGLYNND